MCGFLVDTGSELDTQLVDQAAHLLQHRGPDQSTAFYRENKKFYFHRLAIMDRSNNGQQPFVQDDLVLVCNGEIYNEPTLRQEVLSQFEYTFKSGSDCEVLLPLYQQFQAQGMVQKLDGEFAFVLYDAQTDVFYAGRDAIGIRPLFYGYSKSGHILFSSEAKGLHNLCQEIKTFPPGHFYSSATDSFTPYSQPWEVAQMHTPTLDELTTGIRTRLEEGVIKRLRSDVPVGFLLSGGLDSSLVCSIAARYTDHPIVTFSIGIEDGPIDTHFARQVSEFLGTQHHEVLFSKEEMLAHLDELIYHLETWDITTVRASMGMSLLCRYIRQKTDIKVVLTGEVSDEIFGYKYTDFAPSAEAFQQEAEKRVRELYVYDVLRADRCISMHGLEARVPFSDTDFVSFVMSANPELKVNSYNMGKYLLRKAFADGNYLPDSILYRDKAAFSDAVGHSMVDELKNYAATVYTDEDVAQAQERYPFATPFTAESLLYREIFEKHFPERAALIPDFWMPNKSWEGCDVQDPSARVLSNYGDSGSTPDKVRGRTSA